MVSKLELAIIGCILAATAAIAVMIGFGQGPLGSGAPAARADSGTPDTISAVYDGHTGMLTAEGTYTWPECPEDKKAVGFALFIDGATPTNPGSGALDGFDASDTMHPADMSDYVFPCATSGDWGPDSHALASAPSEVCVVIYDVHKDKKSDLPKTSGNHSTVGAGDKHLRNKDNSYENNEDNFGEGTCVEPEIEYAEGDLTITKSADDAATTHGDTVTYTFNVTYAPGADGSPAQNIILTDPQCDDGTIARGADDPGNDDGLLEDGETWVYTCTFDVSDSHSAGEEDPILNVAHVEGEDLDGDAVTPDDSDEVSVDILHAEGELTIAKSADDATTTHGDTVTYTFNVTFSPGADGSPAQNVSVSDPQCSSAISGPTGDDGDGLLEAGETWTYTCTFSVPADHADGEEDPILNVAHVEGDDLDGDPVAADDSDEVSVDIEHAQVAAATVVAAAVQAPATLPDTGGAPAESAGFSLSLLLALGGLALLGSAGTLVATVARGRR